MKETKDGQEVAARMGIRVVLLSISSLHQVKLTISAQLLQNHDGQIMTLTNNANTTNEVVASLAQSTTELNATVTRQTATVEQYIKARSNGTGSA